MRSKKRIICLLIILSFTALIPLVFMQLRFDPIYWYNIRNDYKIASKIPVVVDHYKDGYVTHVTIDASDLSNDLPDKVNRLSKLEVLRVVYLWNKYSNTCIFDTISKYNMIKEFQIYQDHEDWDDSIFSALQLPSNVTSLRIIDFTHAKNAGGRMNDERLLELSRFSNLKVIMLNDCKFITSTGVEEFNRIRPDIKVYWGEKYNPDPSRVKLLDIITY